MTGGYFLYETGKYGVAFFLIVGLTQRNRYFTPNVAFIFYLLLICLGIAFTTVPEEASLRKAIVFNLSGPILLAVCGFYCYKRKFNKKEIERVLMALVYPVVTMCVYLYFRTPTLEEIVFTGTANWEASGMMGPNQVSTSIGVGIAALSVLLLMKRTFTGFFPVDGIVIVYFTYRALITFSRGGLFTAIIAILIFTFFYLRQSSISVKQLVPYAFITFFIIAGIWLYTSDITGGMLNNRYTGKDKRGVQKEDLSSGRLAILEEQFESFSENPFFGIGVGNGKYKRLSGSKKVTAASHNELGRLMEEHGLIGLSAIVLLFLLPIYLFSNMKSFNKPFLLFFINRLAIFNGFNDLYVFNGIRFHL